MELISRASKEVMPPGARFGYEVIAEVRRHSNGNGYLVRFGREQTDRYSGEPILDPNTGLKIPRLSAIWMDDFKVMFEVALKAFLDAEPKFKAMMKERIKARLEAEKQRLQNSDDNSFKKAVLGFFNPEEEEDSSNG